MMKYNIEQYYDEDCGEVILENKEFKNGQICFKEYDVISMENLIFECFF